MDVRWLSAPDNEVAAAMAALRRKSRPSWVPTKRQVLVHVNNSLILWYLCIALMTIGIRVDSQQDGRVYENDIEGMVVTAIVLIVWLCGTYWLHRWAARPPSPRARLTAWRQDLTALANGFEPSPSGRVTFTSLISPSSRGIRMFPRFVDGTVEFGNLVYPGGRGGGWHYLAVKLPAPLPHLILDARSNDRRGSDLPAAIHSGQFLSLEGDFDKWFRVYAPRSYGREALYVLSPDVMAALIDDASQYNVEIVDDTLVFFTSPAADFGQAATWQSLHAALDSVAPRIVSSARRYRDNRVLGQEHPSVLTQVRDPDASADAGASASVDAHLGAATAPPAPRIGPDGRRLRVGRSKTGEQTMVGFLCWIGTGTVLYAFPGLFAFTGFMSIVDGR